MINTIIFIIIAFFIGGIPFGLIIGKLCKNIDIREHGSGNIGATNIARTIGFKYAIVVFILDGLKTFLPVFMAKTIYNSKEYAIFIAFFSIIGHIFSPWLKGKGGKGISSTIFALLAVDYRLFLVMSIVWILCFEITKISAVAAIISIIVTLVSSYFLSSNFVFIVMLMLTLVILFAHRKNIKRIISGEEFGFGKK